MKASKRDRQISALDRHEKTRKAYLNLLERGSATTETCCACDSSGMYKGNTCPVCAGMGKIEFLVLDENPNSGKCRADILRSIRNVERAMQLTEISVYGSSKTPHTPAAWYEGIDTAFSGRPHGGRNPETYH